ncbi:sugar phosphate nucleotidyltransferase, partial [Streptomyces decoyicus]
MIGLVLAAGAGRRLRPYTDTLPKALVPVDGDTTILDLTLGNFAEIGLTEVAIIVGYRKEAVYERKEALEQKYGLKLTLIDNDKAEEWNNAYS